MTIKAAVIGHPIAHSLSPLIHGHWLSKYKISGTYETIDIHPDDLQVHIQRIFDQGYAGFNVTLPHKQNIVHICDVVDDTASAIGAVNTVYLNQGKITGTNTDAYGFIQNLKAQHPGIEMTSSQVMVLGAGGAARAAVYALLQEGAQQIYIANRTMDKALSIAEDFGDDRICAVPWDRREAYNGDISLLVNTTSLGMESKPALDFDVSTLCRDAIVYDIVYAPLITPLLLAGREEGLKITTGIGMLLHQARPAFKKWFGILPDIDDNLTTKVLKP